MDKLVDYRKKIKTILTQYDNIANELLREGIPKEDIVLAFYDPETRKLTEFAVA